MSEDNESVSTEQQLPTPQLRAKKRKPYSLCGCGCRDDDQKRCHVYFGNGDGMEYFVIPDEYVDDEIKALVEENKRHMDEFTQEWAWDWMQRWRKVADPFRHAETKYLEVIHPVIICELNFNYE